MTDVLHALPYHAAQLRHGVWVAPCLMSHASCLMPLSGMVLALFLPCPAQRLESSLSILYGGKTRRLQRWWRRLKRTWAEAAAAKAAKKTKKKGGKKKKK